MFSLDEQTNFKLATENLIQAIISNRMDKKPESSLSLSEEIDSSTETQLQHPKCVTAQPSIAIMPRVPTRSTVIAIAEEDEKSCDNYIDTSEHRITTNEQFENILQTNREKSENILILKDSIAYNNEQPNWAYYSAKPDLFSTTLRSDLPIIQSEDQHLSFKQNFLSHFHRRPKLTSGNHPATFHSSSLNANDHIKSSLTSKQQITQTFLNDKSSLNSIWNKTLNHLKQGIFRVRKSRIIISFDHIQQEKDGKKIYLQLLSLAFSFLAGNHDLSLEINQLQTKV